MKFQQLQRFAIVVAMLALIIGCSKPGGDGEESAGASAAMQEPGVPVEVLVVETKSAEQNIPLTGVLKPMHSVEIVAEVSGKVRKIHKKLGDYVSTRDTMAFIDDVIPLSNYRQAESQVLSAKNNLKIAQLNLQSDKDLFENGDISKLAYENSLLALKSAEASHLSALANLSSMEKMYMDTRVMSPFNGLVSRKYIDIGTMVSPNTPLFRVVELSRLKIEVGIPQSTINQVRLGSAAKVTISSLNNQVHDGIVRFISPEADEATGTFNTEIQLKNTKDLELRAGMTAKIQLTANKVEKQIVIPDYARITRDNKEYVYKINGNKAQLTEIRVSESFGSQYVVDNGLATGDTIVVVGMKNLGVDTRVWIETVNE